MYEYSNSQESKINEEMLNITAATDLTGGTILRPYLAQQEELRAYKISDDTPPP